MDRRWCFRYNRPTIHTTIDGPHSNHFPLMSRFSENPQKNQKNLPIVLMLLSKNSCIVKTGGNFYQILWPSHNVLTLLIKSYLIKTYLWLIRHGFHFPDERNSTWQRLTIFADFCLLFPLPSSVIFVGS